MVVLALALALAPSAPRRSGTNGVWAEFAVETLSGGGFCQARELLPSGTTAIRLALEASRTPGPGLQIVLRRHGRVLQRTSAVAGIGGPQQQSVSAPIERTSRDLDDVQICVTVGTGGELLLIGGPTFGRTGRLVVNGHSTGASLAIDYLRPGEASWWAVASTIASRIARGRGSLGGRWIVWLLAALVLCAIALSSATVWRTLVVERSARDDDHPTSGVDAGRALRLRGLLRRMPSVAWAVAAVAVLNAAAWSIVTPAFQVPDENTHVAYVQLIGERGRPPADRSKTIYAPELDVIAGDIRGAAVWSPFQQRKLERDLHASLARRGNDSAGPSSPEPPLYYAIEAIPYRLASGATLLDRVALMRLLSALMAGVTALFVVLFVRECVPSRPWAWTVGGLGVAATPMLGFVSGGVNPDALLFAISGALFYCLARAFRRGMTTRLAVWIGVVLAVGVIGKINFYGLVPGAIVAIALAARMTEGTWNRRVLRLVGVALIIGVAPYVLITTLDALVWERPFILARTPAEAPEDHGNLGGQLSYLWQVFFPRLPGQSVAIPDYYPGWELWFKRLIGNFGWLVVRFPAWGYRFAVVVVGAVVALALRALWRDRDEVRRRRAELIGYGSMTFTLTVLIGLVALRGWAPGVAAAAQGRYLLPLLPLWGALLALGARGAGERWGRAAGALIVATAIGWSLFGQLMTIAFFYG